MLRAYDNYISAVRNCRGQEALRYVDSRTIKYYDDLIKVIKSADNNKVNSLSFIDKIAVYFIRSQATKSEIAAMDGAGLFIYTIEKNVANNNSSTYTTAIADITIDKEFAIGHTISGGKKAAISCYFYKEADKWKFDLIHLFVECNLAFNKMVKKGGGNENKYLFMHLEKITGKKSGFKIWQQILN